MDSEYETVIGLEVHTQLLTRSKMFCSCGSDYQNAAPNTRVCETCMGMPGVLPVINKKAIELVIKTGLALGCRIAIETKFDRKNYPYPDLMKGYQISQYDMPIAVEGMLRIETAKGIHKNIKVTRVHLEEDVAKLLHKKDPRRGNYSLLDINRAGVPLMEIVSEPEISSPEEANSYLTNLHSIIRYIAVSTANMEEGSFRCDANISLKPTGSETLGSKVEVKNVNSFRSVFKALKYEEKRQLGALKAGEKIIQETRGWSDDRGTTISQRTKEYASDYRYFPEPDLPPVHISRSWVKQVKTQIPELPNDKSNRFEKTFGLSEYDAKLLSSNKSAAELFDETIRKLCHPLKETVALRAKSLANIINVEVARLVNESGSVLEKSEITATSLADLILMIQKGQLTSNNAKIVLEQLFTNGGSPSLISQKMNLTQISDANAINSTIREVISENSEAINDFLAGKESVLQYLVGQVMKKTKGSANPQITITAIRSSLEELR